MIHKLRVLNDSYSTQPNESLTVSVFGGKVWLDIGDREISVSYRDFYKLIKMYEDELTKFKTI